VITIEKEKKSSINW